MPPVPSKPAGREPRSRLDRPCDACRRHKHMCMIPVRGEPCVSCQARSKECTFLIPPTARKRKRNGESSQAGPSRLSHPPAVVPAPDLPRWLEEEAILPRLDAPNPMPAEFSAPVDVHELPLDDEVDADDDEETHFIGSGAFVGLIPRDAAAAPRPAFSEHATLAFRQVSANPRLPAYFIKHPSLLYGRGPSTAEAALDEVRRLCATAGHDLPELALTKFTAITLPALPFVQPHRLSRQGSTVPHALIAGIVAHCTCYIPEIRPLHTSLWQQALLALEDDYRQPRLRTLQLALLILTSRPNENVGQHQIGLARAVGAAHLLGLHMDPTQWALPQWEKSIRTRIWWTLFIHDKWRALLYGRPSNLHKSNYNVPLPTAAVDEVSPPSLDSFLATCRLTLIFDKLLERFYSVQSISNPPGDVTRLALLESIRSELDGFETALPASLRSGSAATGVRSFQLSLCGVQVVVHRTIVEILPSTPAPHVGLALADALAACHRLSAVVLGLTPVDRDMFWMPFSPLHIANAVSLLLRIALFHRDAPNLDAIACMITLVESLVQTYAETGWDVAEGALRRAAVVLLVGSREITTLEVTYRTVADVLGLNVASDEPATSTDLLESLGLPSNEVDSLFSWLDSEILWGAFEAGSQATAA